MTQRERFFMSLDKEDMDKINNIVLQINETKSRECSKTNRQEVTRALVKLILAQDLRFKSTWTKCVSASLKTGSIIANV